MIALILTFTAFFLVMTLIIFAVCYKGWKHENARIGIRLFLLAILCLLISMFIFIMVGLGTQKRVFERTEVQKAFGFKSDYHDETALVLGYTKNGDDYEYYYKLEENGELVTKSDSSDKIRIYIIGKDEPFEYKTLIYKYESIYGRFFGFDPFYRTEKSVPALLCIPEGAEWEDITCLDY